MVTYSFKAVFEAHKILDAMDKKIKRVLDLTGLDTRNAMKRGMKSGGKRNKKHSKPGEYPFYHQGGSGGLRAIKFETDMVAKTVAVGPLRFARTKEDIPSLVNFGGKVRQEISLARSGKENRRKKRKSNQIPRDSRVQVQRVGRYKLIKNFTIEPRPFIALTQPAGIAAIRKHMAKVDF